MERGLWEEGCRLVGGVDEVGRGAWAGPLSVGIALAHPSHATNAVPGGVRDSKALSERRREAVFDDVGAWCAASAVGHASAEECDRWGMSGAWKLAAHRALSALPIEPDALIVDGPYDLFASAALLPELQGARVPPIVRPVVGGDARCATVAAASVLAKVVRDRTMRDAAVDYPHYGFERNKGYPSLHHQIALRGYGLSSIHRSSWSYVERLPWGRASKPLRGAPPGS